MNPLYLVGAVGAVALAIVIVVLVRARLREQRRWRAWQRFAMDPVRRGPLEDGSPVRPVGRIRR